MREVSPLSRHGQVRGNREVETVLCEQEVLYVLVCCVTWCSVTAVLMHRNVCVLGYALRTCIYRLQSVTAVLMHRNVCVSGNTLRTCI